MEKRIQKKADYFMQQFKNDIKIKMTQQSDITSTENNSNILQFIFDYPALSFSKEDFQKRKRMKNQVPYHMRCLARRANKEQCTRRKKGDGCYCGTHIKGTPHGVYEDLSNQVADFKKAEVWVEEIKGINYYIDNKNNVYDPALVIAGSNDNKVIAKYKVTNGVYEICELEI